MSLTGVRFSRGSRKLAIAFYVKGLVVLIPQTDWLTVIANDRRELGYLYCVRYDLETILVKKLKDQATFSIPGVCEVL